MMSGSRRVAIGFQSSGRGKPRQVEVDGLVLGAPLGDVRPDGMHQVRVAGPHHLREGRARLHPALRQPERPRARDDEGHLTPSGDGDVQHHLAWCACATDAVPGGHCQQAATRRPRDAQLFGAITATGHRGMGRRHRRLDPGGRPVPDRGRRFRDNLAAWEASRAMAPARREAQREATR